MGVDIAGWVEVKPDPEILEITNAWVGIIGHLAFLVGRDHDASRLIFGINQSYLADPMSKTALAHERGIPTDASEEVRQSLQAIPPHIPDQPFGMSWVLWSELTAHGFTQRPWESEWPILFKLMEVLADRYGGDSVRLVIWFSW